MKKSWQSSKALPPSCAPSLSLYDQVPGQLGPFQEEITSPREHFFWMLTLENGIASMRANLAWAESVIERIKNGEVPQK